MKEEEKKKAEDIFSSLAFSNNSIKEFCNVFIKKYKVKEFKDYLFLEDNKTIVFPKLTYNKLMSDDLTFIVNKTKKHTPKKIIIPTGEISDEAKILADSLEGIKIILLNKYQTFQEIYEKFEYFPEINIKFKKKSKNTFKALLMYSFNKKRTKGYFFAGLILVFSSFFVRYNLYYLIMSSLLLLFSLISYFNPFVNKKTDSIF